MSGWLFCAHSIPAPADMRPAHGTVRQMFGMVRALTMKQYLTPGTHAANFCQTNLLNAAQGAARQMFDKARALAKKASQARNPNNLRFEALRCVIALQATKPAVATPFKEDIVVCLRSSDASLRHLAAEVLYNSTTADNLSGVAEQVRCFRNQTTYFA